MKPMSTYIYMLVMVVGKEKDIVRATVTLGLELKKDEQLTAIEEDFSKKFNEQCIIVNYVLMRTEHGAQI